MRGTGTVLRDTLWSTVHPRQDRREERARVISSLHARNKLCRRGQKHEQIEKETPCELSRARTILHRTPRAAKPGRPARSREPSTRDKHKHASPNSKVQFAQPYGQARRRKEKQCSAKSKATPCKHCALIQCVACAAAAGSTSLPMWEWRHGINSLFSVEIIGIRRH